MIWAAVGTGKGESYSSSNLDSFRSSVSTWILKDARSHWSLGRYGPEANWTMFRVSREVNSSAGFLLHLASVLEAVVLTELHQTAREHLKLGASS